MRFSFTGAALLLSLAPYVASSQRGPSGPVPADSVRVVPGAKFAAGGFYGFWFGHTYRDLWTTPLSVEVLDIGRFAGGLRAVKEGGGLQTKSLKLAAANGTEYTFRLVEKYPMARHAGSLVDRIFRDQVSASMPLGAGVAASLLDATGVWHVTPTIYVMGDDPALGEFRKEFAGRLGIIEESPDAGHHSPDFGGAAEIIDSEELLKLLNKDARELIDARALLAARLMDMLMNDVDRHPGQWKWARMQSKPRSPWIPIPRDRDQAFISFGGTMLRIGRLAAPNLIPFHGEVPRVSGLSVGAIEFDRRLLGGLEKPVWDSITASLIQRLPDAVIDAAVRKLPAEYVSVAPRFAAILKRRRDLLPAAARAFYEELALTPDVHGTDDADRLIVARLDDRYVDVRLESMDGTPFFHRRFDATETPEVRVYLHGGSDSAVVTGRVNRSIRVRIIGGNGMNALVDSSTVGGSRSLTHLYDEGQVKAVTYGLDTSFHRVPWVGEHGTVVPPGRDRGAKFGLSVGGKLDRTLRAVPRVSLNRYWYGFGNAPYASRAGLDAEYSTGIQGVRLGLTGDKRFERTPFHVVGRVRFSQLELLNDHGLGNATFGPDTGIIQVRQQQWLVEPAIALPLGLWSEVTLGPAFQVSQTHVVDVRPGVDTDPYGFGHFSQLGVRLALHHEMRDQVAEPHRRFVLDVSAAVTPPILDVTRTFESVTGVIGMYFTVPVPLSPTLAIRAGGRKLFGDFPFQEAAFIGGRSTVRSLSYQRFAGDASVYGTTELRVRLASFDLLVPMDFGVVGLVDAGRVYVNSNSPGEWHVAEGGGVWLSLLHRPTTFSLATVSGQVRVGTLINTGLTLNKRH